MSILIKLILKFVHSFQRDFEYQQHMSEALLCIYETKMFSTGIFASSLSSFKYVMYKFNFYMIRYELQNNILIGNINAQVYYSQLPHRHGGWGF